MTRQGLLRELERLTHDQRMRRMVEIGRRAAAEADVAAALDALAGGDAYERRLALQACHGSRDGARVLRALGDPSRVVRGLALGMVAPVCDDRQAEAAFDLLGPVERRRLLMRLRERRRTALVDALLGRLAAADDALLVAVLPDGSAEAAGRHLARAFRRARPHDWRRLARHHPRLAVDALVAALPSGEADGATVDERLLARANAALAGLAGSDPDRGLALVRSLAPRVPLGRLDVHQLAPKRPVELADLVLAPGQALDASLGLVVHRLRADQLAAIVARGGVYRWGGPLLLHRLAPEKRGAVYAAAEVAWRDGDGLVSPLALGLLPGALREREARRHLALPVVAGRPAVRLAYAALLPGDEAWAALAAHRRDPDVDLRTAALAGLVAVAGCEPARLDDLLALLRGHRNEPDPVRQKALMALAAVPAGRWGDDHLDDLGRIVRDAVDAADMSYQTASAALRLLIALLPRHPAWAAGWTATLLRETGQWWELSAGAEPQYELGRSRVRERLEDRLGDAEAARLAEELLPVLRAWPDRYEDGVDRVLRVARALGRRLRALPGLVDLLSELLVRSRSPEEADGLLGWLARHAPGRLAELLPTLLRRDPSWMTRPTVARWLHRERQELLTPFLGRRSVGGRFRSGRGPFVLPLFAPPRRRRANPHRAEQPSRALPGAGGFHRWTARQQHRFAATLEAVARDERADVPTRMAAVAGLAALPAVPLDRLALLGRDERTAVREAATRALGRVDAAGEAVPLLVEALGDERAAVAVYSLRRAIVALPPGPALALLRAVPTDRLTVAKEAVRLRGEVGSEAAYEDLLAIDRTEPHRDVRTALLRALWRFPERPETWAILRRAAESGEPAHAAAAARVPDEGISPEAYARLVELLGARLAHPDGGVREAVLERLTERPIDDPTGRLLPALMDRLGSARSDERAMAAAAVVVVYGPRTPERVGAELARRRADRRAVTALLEAFRVGLVEEAVTPGSAGFRRQKIPRRAIRRMRQQPHGTSAWLAYTRLPRLGRERLAPLARAVLAALAEDPLTVARRLELAVGALPWGEVAELLGGLAAGGELHAEALMTAVHAVERSGRSDVEALAALEAALGASGDERLRRVALAALAALVALAGPPRGWTEERRARLDAYRADPSPLVAAAAAFTLLPENAEPPG